ncbi:MAG: hypothetical protein ABSF08_07375, partial [Candidatus Cybelea sp.]
MGVILLIPAPAAAITIILLRRRARLKRVAPLQGGLVQALSYAVFLVFVMMFITGLDFLGLQVWFIDHRKPSTYVDAVVFVIIMSALQFFVTNAFEKPPISEDWLLWDKGSKEEGIK